MLKQGRPKIKDKWDNQIEGLLQECAKPKDARRYRMACEGFSNFEIGLREGIISDTVRASVSRCRVIIKTGRPLPIRKKIKNKCEVCGKAEILVWNGDHGHVCCRCYITLKRIALQQEARENVGSKYEEVTKE